jgi:hypothetical protein
VHYFTSYDHLFITQTVFSEHVEKPLAWVYDLSKRKKGRKHKNYDTIYAFSFFHERQQILTKHKFVPGVNVLFFGKYWFSIKNIWRLYLFLFFTYEFILFAAKRLFFSRVNEPFLVLEVSWSLWSVLLELWFEIVWVESVEDGSDFKHVEDLSLSFLGLHSSPCRDSLHSFKLYFRRCRPQKLLSKIPLLSNFPSHFTIKLCFFPFRNSQVLQVS